MGVTGVGPQIAAWRAQCPDRLYTEALRGSVEQRWHAILTPDQIKEGWRFDPSTASVTLVEVHGVRLYGTRCDPVKIAVTSEQFSYGIVAHAGPRSPATVVCYVEPSITMIRDVPASAP